MPKAHFKGFNGIAPRKRGETSNASECVNVDLYGSTLRPYPDDAVLTNPTQDGRFIRVAGNIHFIAGAVDIQLQSFKGYHVVLYKTSARGQWFKKVFEDPTGVGAIITPLGFNPPVFSSDKVTPAFTGSQGIEFPRIAGRVNKVRRQDGAKSKESYIIPADTYTYMVDIVKTIDGEEKILGRKEWSVLLEYDYYRDLSDAQYEAKILSRGKQLSGEYRELIPGPYANPTEYGAHQFLYDYPNGPTFPILNQYGFAVPNTPIASNVVMFGNPRVEFPNLTNVDPSDIDNLNKFPRWAIPFRYKQGENYAKLSSNSIDSLIKANADLGTLPAAGQISHTGGSSVDTIRRQKGSAAIEAGDITQAAESSDYQGVAGQDYVVLKNENNFSDDYRRMAGYVYEKSKNRIVNADYIYYPPSSDADEQAGINPYQYEIIFKSPFHGTADAQNVTFKLYRKGSNDVAPYLMKEAKADANGAVVLIDNNQTAGETAVRAETLKTYRYITTLSRLAGVSDVLGDWEEESGPSEEVTYEAYQPSAVISRPDQLAYTVGSQGTTTSVQQKWSSDVEYTYWNIYRLTEGTNGTEEFQLVAQVDKAQQTYTDDVDDEDLGSTSESIFLSDPIPYVYEEMPNGLSLAVAPYNGMLFGWKGGSLHWTDRFYFSGWSSDFNAELPYPIVNIVPLGNAMAIVTTHGVYRATSSGPQDFSFVESPSGEGGIENLKETVIGTDKGVMFLSDSGIHLYDGVRSSSITDTAVGEEYFRTDLDLSVAILRENDGIIHLFHGAGVMIFDMRSSQIATMSEPIVKEVFRDHQSGSLLYLSTNNQVYELFSNTIKFRNMLYRTGSVHFGHGGRKRIKYIQFLGTGSIQCTPYINGSDTGLKSKLVNMGGMENDARLYLPANATLDTLELAITGKGEVEEFFIDWERL